MLISSDGWIFFFAQIFEKVDFFTLRKLLSDFRDCLFYYSVHCALSQTWTLEGDKTFFTIEEKEEDWRKIAAA